MAVGEGEKAPGFKLPSTKGREISLSDFKGDQAVVLYFYPKDDTPGCTKEACDFRDSIKKLKARGAAVLGVSGDSLSSHEKFQRKYSLPFPLLSDENREVIKNYGVWKEKSMYGKKYMGIERTTIIIDKQGKIARIFAKVKVDGHIEEVIEAVSSLK